MSKKVVPKFDLVGLRLGMLVVVSLNTDTRKSDSAHWNCVCDCGGTAVVSSGELRRKKTEKRAPPTSCGCLRGMRHGMRHTPEYKLWTMAQDRCHNPRNPSYHNYGGRGIFVAQEWRDDFLTFYAAIGDRPGPEYSLDRIDNNRGYEPGNVRWATIQMQSVNKRRTHFVETPSGETLPITYAARKYGITPDTIKRRMKRGFHIADVFRQGQLNGASAALSQEETK